MTAGLQRKVDELQRQILAIKKKLSPAALSGTVTAAPHAVTHEEGGSDEIDITLLGGFPGGATDFLREDGTFQPVSGGSGITELTSDVTAGPGTGSQAATIANNAVTDAKLRDSAANSVIGRSANSSGDPADIASSTDGQVLRRAAGVVGWGAVDLADPDAVTGVLPLANVAARSGVIGIQIGDGAAVITTGVKRFVRITFACTLTGWTLLSNDAAATAGAIKIDVWKDVYANYPPDNSDSITNGHEPEIVATNNRAEDTNIADWTSVAVAAGDVIGFNVDSVTALTAALLEITTTVP